MKNCLTGEEFKTNCNDDSINSFIINSVATSNDSLIFRRNNNGLSIANVILKNTTCSIDDFKNYISRANAKPSEKFIRTVCEAGVDLDLFKYLYLNYKDEITKKTLDSAFFGGNYDMIHILESDYAEYIDDGTLIQAYAGEDCDVVEYLMDNYFNNNFFSLDRNKKSNN